MYEDAPTLPEYDEPQEHSTWYDEFGDMHGECELCGEEMYDNDNGEFDNGERAVVAHAQCGIDAGLESA